MRSDLVYSAGRSIENRFLLVTVASRVIRSLHIDSTRTQETATQALTDISRGYFAPAALPEPAPQPCIEVLTITPAA
uniref:DNA-directed RNA polymerase subunit omega n=1 Tax=Acidobacterium capsulatum TaxID=33075 RepID=A0A7V4XSI7_9BACT